MENKKTSCRRLYKQPDQERMHFDSSVQEEGETSSGTFLIPPLPGSTSPNQAYNPIVYELKSYELKGEMIHPYPTICKIYKAVFHNDNKGKGRDFEVAIKVLDLEVKKIETEPSPPVSHPNLVPQEFIHLQQYQLCLVIMPLLNLGSTRDLLAFFDNGLPEQFIAVILKQVLLGIKPLHERGYFHKHIKPGNILLDNIGTPKIQLCPSFYTPDITSLHPLSEDNSDIPYWVPPELRGVSESKFYSQNHSYKFAAADIWSIGVTALELAYGEAPLSETVPCYSMYKRVGKPEHDPNQLRQNKVFSNHFSEFVAGCLIEDPRDRPTACDLLQMPFIKSITTTSTMTDFLDIVSDLKHSTQTEKIVKWSLDTHLFKLKPTRQSDQH